MSKRDDGPLGVMMQELTMGLDLGALFTDPVFYGIRVAPGDGKLVVILPGFMGNDLYLLPMLNWLWWIGYTPVRSSLNLSAGCMQRSLERVQAEIDRHLNRKERSVALIGHSRGGAIAWAIAAHMQEQVSHLVMLGAPMPGFNRSVEDGERKIRLGGLTRMLLHANKLSRRLLDPDCRFPSCECAFMNYAERPLSKATALLSIYGSDDLVIPEQAKMFLGKIIDVPTGHVGLVYNPEVYRALAQFLAQNNGRGEPRRHRTQPHA
jgi:pimeloyl-ACP methyl ester carboxylesterase